jgi:endonuclease-3 related protein
LDLLERAYGGSDWWPGNSPFEIAVGAILTQRASWRNVEYAIAELEAQGLLEPAAMASADIRVLEAAIRPSGFYHQKAAYISAFADYLTTRHGGDMTRMRETETTELRRELLELHGVGPETADSILLYALGRPSFVVDAYTIRLLRRLGLREDLDYESVKRRFEVALKGDVEKYRRMHALIVIHCKERCSARPKCFGCPLRSNCRSEREYKEKQAAHDSG